METFLTPTPTLKPSLVVPRHRHLGPVGGSHWFFGPCGVLARDVFSCNWGGGKATLPLTN